MSGQLESSLMLMVIFETFHAHSESLNIIVCSDYC